MYLRKMEAGRFYHVFNRGVNRETIFKECKNYQYFLDRYRSYLSDHLNTFGYCLMPNHFHLFVQVREEHENTDAVIKAFKNFFISYAKAINRGYHRTGSLFQNNFKKKEIDRDSYFSMIIAYLHLNPVRAGLAKRPEDWKYSSYNALCSDKPTQICKNEVLEWFGGVDAFIKFHQSFKMDDEVDFH